MADNFVHLPPDALSAAFLGAPLAFHVMNSQFLTRPDEELRLLADLLKNLIAHLKPRYVSDHLAVFARGGRRLPFPQEVDYRAEGAGAIEKIKRWQDMLGVPLLLENYPSILDLGRDQPEFLERMTRETGAGLLLDLSNAVVAHKNCGSPLADWENLAVRADCFHVAGYRGSGTEPEFLVDSHDGELSPETIAFLRTAAPKLANRDASIVVERDANISQESWSRDIAAAKEALA